VTGLKAALRTRSKSIGGQDDLSLQFIASMPVLTFPIVSAPCGPAGETAVEFVKTTCEVRGLQCLVFSSGLLPADGIRMHLETIRHSLGPLPLSLQPHCRHRLPRPGRNITTQGRSDPAPRVEECPL
jgi:hypothetical protein